MTINTPRSGRSAATALALVLIGVCCLAIVRPGVRPAGLMRDFNAFYCAGRAIAVRADPYRTEPLGSCERERKPPPLLTGAPGLVMPAPLPPYALLPFVVLAQLPYVASAIGWGCCILLAVAIAALALRRVTGMPLGPLLAALALTDGYASLCLGQVAPIAVAAIAVAAMWLEQRRDVAAALAASVAMIEPHVGLPACLAIFVWRGRSRLALIGVGVGCVLASLALAGVPTTLEYVRAVVPAHALSEVANEKQFSLTFALHRFGIADALAARLGAIWYFAMLASGVALARVVAKRTGDRAALAVIPPALAVVGGPFVHVVQIAVALPAAFVLYGHASPNVRRALGIGIVLLAVPWIQFLNLGTVFVLLAPPIVAILTASLVDRRPLVIVASAVGTALFLDALIASITAPFGDATRVLLAHYDATSLAEASWTTYVSTIGAANPQTFDAARIPTLLGLATIVCAAIGAALKSPGEVPMIPGELKTTRFGPPRGRETVPKELST